MRFFVVSFLFLLCIASSAASQTKFDYSDLSKGIFSQRSISGLRSMKDGEHYTTSQNGSKIMKFNYATGEQVGVIFDSEKTDPKIRFSSYTFSHDGEKILFTTDVKSIYRHSSTAQCWIYDVQANTLKKLSDNGAQQEATFSPDATKVAFVRENNLFIVDLASGKEIQITNDGLINHIINGAPDWVYEEEFGFSRGFEWSPDGASLAYMRFDESRVKEYNMNMFNNQLYPSNYSFKYPKAGEENSIVEVYRYDLASGRKTKIDVGTVTDQYIPRILWTTGGELLVYRLNRQQNRFDVLLADANGATRPIYQESNDRYIERVDNGTLTFLPDGDRFIVRSEKDGFMHLYMYSIKKGFLNKITDGDWEVVSVAGVDKDDLYYISTEGSPLRRDLYTIKLNGKGKKRLTGGDGTYRVSPSTGFKYFISYFTNATTPTRVTLHTADGKLVRTLEDNAALKAKLTEMQVPVKEFFKFKTSEGIELNGYMTKPSNFDPNKEYPLFMTQYSGPGSQSAADTWGIGWEDVLVQEGYIVACVDGRGTGYRGEDFKKCTYKQLGKYEVEDQIEAAKYLGSLPYVDKGRIGIFGWSYGGFMSLNSILKGNDVFKVAIAVAPVTSWRYYDTIYTEIYNGDPNTNPSGYDDNSPINFADRLKGKLLLAHGTGDDNVHIQNSYEMMSRLIKAGKPFEMYICPDQNHGMGFGRNHLMIKCIDFVKKEL